MGDVWVSLGAAVFFSVCHWHCALQFKQRPWNAQGSAPKHKTHSFEKSHGCCQPSIQNNRGRLRSVQKQIPHWHSHTDPKPADEQLIYSVKMLSFKLFHDISWSSFVVTFVYNAHMVAYNVWIINISNYCRKSASNCTVALAADVLAIYLFFRVLQNTTITNHWLTYIRLC